MIKPRNLVIGMLLMTVIAPILLYSGRFASSNPLSSRRELLEDITAFTLPGDTRHLNVLPLESTTLEKEPIGFVYANNSTENASDQFQELQDVGERKSTRVLSTTDEQVDNTVSIRQVTSDRREDGWDAKQDGSLQSQGMTTASQVGLKQSDKASSKVKDIDPKTGSTDRQSQLVVASDARVRQLKDQLIRAKAYLTLPATKSNSHYSRELRTRIKDIQRALGDASKDSDLPKNPDERMKAMDQKMLAKAMDERMKAMDQMLAKGKQMQDDCPLILKKLRAMLHSTEEQLRVHKKQTLFLTQLTAKTLPKGLHCLPLRLTNEYYTLNPSEQQFPNQARLEDPQLYHYALFSDNVLAASVVVNSTISHAKHPSKHVFHVVTDRLNYAAMRMWFLVNPPGKAAIQVQNIEDFTWLNSSYSPVLKQLASQSMIDYYFRAHRANSDPNLKYRNPKYLSILNHLRFYLPEIFPKLNKVLFLDDDIVVQKDLTGLWSIDLKGHVNGAVETCGENFHRFDRYLNFSHPLIAKNFDPRACGWAYGMNIFDLAEWKRKNITEVYHSWQNLNHDRQLWKLGTLPPGLITFWKQTYPLARSWHVLGLGYDPSVGQRDIERAAVIHYNGNMKPWLEIGIPKFRGLWAKYVDYNHIYLRECNINP